MNRPFGIRMALALGAMALLMTPFGALHLHANPTLRVLAAEAVTVSPTLGTPLDTFTFTLAGFAPG